MLRQQYRTTKTKQRKCSASASECIISINGSNMTCCLESILLLSTTFLSDTIQNPRRALYRTDISYVTIQCGLYCIIRHTIDNSISYLKAGPVYKRDPNLVNIAPYSARQSATQY